jgi:hypothetical protein
MAARPMRPKREKADRKPSNLDGSRSAFVCPRQSSVNAGKPAGSGSGFVQVLDIA